MFFQEGQDALRSSKIYLIPGEYPGYRYRLSVFVQFDFPVQEVPGRQVQLVVQVFRAVEADWWTGFAGAV